jgi:hypothetical protein
VKKTRIDRWLRSALYAISMLLCAVSLGCSATPLGLAMHIAGDAVHDVDQKQRSKELVGAPVARADDLFGAPVEVLADTQSDRTWRLYHVPSDLLDTLRYVVEVRGSRILAVDKVQKYSDLALEEGLLAVLRPKVKDKPPAECEANLKMGPPLLTVRSRTTGQMIELYDARVLKELQRPYYCVLRFGPTDTCEQVSLVKMYSSTGDEPGREQGP